MDDLEHCVTGFSVDILMSSSLDSCLKWTTSKMIPLSFVYATLIFWLIFHIVSRIFFGRSTNKSDRQRFKLEYEIKNKFEQGWLWMNYETSSWNAFFNTFKPAMIFPQCFFRLYCLYFKLSGLFVYILYPIVLATFSCKFFFSLLISPSHSYLSYFLSYRSTHKVSSRISQFSPFRKRRFSNDNKQWLCSSDSWSDSSIISFYILSDRSCSRINSSRVRARLCL